MKIEEIYRTEARKVIEDIVKEAFEYELPEKIESDDRDPPFQLQKKFLNGYTDLDKQYTGFYSKFSNSMVDTFNMTDDFNPTWSSSSPSIVQNHLTNAILHGAFLALYNGTHSIVNGEEPEPEPNERKSKDELAFEAQMSKKAAFKFGKAKSMIFDYKYDEQYNASITRKLYQNIPLPEEPTPPPTEAPKSETTDSTKTDADCDCDSKNPSTDAKKDDAKKDDDKQETDDDKQETDDDKQETDDAKNETDDAKNDDNKEEKADQKTTGGKKRGTRKQTQRRKKNKTIRPRNSKGKRKQKALQIGGGGYITDIGQVMDDIIFPILGKTPEQLLRMIIPMARAQMKKVINEKLEKNPKQVRLFVLNSIEIVTNNIIKEQGDVWFVEFDKNMKRILHSNLKLIGNNIIEKKYAKQIKKHKKNETNAKIKTYVESLFENSSSEPIIDENDLTDNRTKPDETPNEEESKEENTEESKEGENEVTGESKENNGEENTEESKEETESNGAEGNKGKVKSSENEDAEETNEEEAKSGEGEGEGEETKEGDEQTGGDGEEAGGEGEEAKEGEEGEEANTDISGTDISGTDIPGAQSMPDALGDMAKGMGQPFAPEDYEPCCTPFFLDTNYLLSLLKLLLMLGASIPEFNILPEEMEAMFTDEIFQSLMQECLCENIYEILTKNADYMASVECMIKQFPLGLRYKEEYTKRGSSSINQLFAVKFKDEKPKKDKTES